MSERTRKQAFAAVCLLVTGAVAALLALSGDREPARRASIFVKSVDPPTPPAPGPDGRAACVSLRGDRPTGWGARGPAPTPRVRADASGSATPGSCAASSRAC